MITDSTTWLAGSADLSDHGGVEKVVANRSGVRPRRCGVVDVRGAGVCELARGHGDAHASTLAPRPLSYIRWDGSGAKWVDYHVGSR